MGSRIKDVAGSQTQFNPDLVLLVDKVDTGSGDWLTARKLKLGITGNTRFQGSVNNINWHDNIEAEDEYFKFSTDGGTIWKDLSTINVKEDTNLYFTEARVLATTGVQDAIDDSHTHTNKTLLDSIIDNGDGNSFLADDGTYFNVLGGLTEGTLPVKGALGFEDSPIFVDGTSVKIGDATNNVEFEADGTIKFNGTATVFDDVTYDAIALQQTGAGISINNTEGTVDYLTSANQADYMFVNSQMPHARKNGAVIYPHIHFFQAENNIPNFALQYRWQLNGGAKTTAWTAIKCNTPVFTYVSGTLNQIVKPATGITPPANDNISDIVQFRIIRDTTNALGLTYGADPYTTTVRVLQFDVHIEKDNIGSDTEYSK